MDLTHDLSRQNDGRDARSTNENTPKARTLLDHMRLDSSCTSRNISTSEKQHLVPSSQTPKTPGSRLAEHASSIEFSISNPFDNHSAIDSLLQPSFSPSVFRINESNTTNSETTPSSFWSIDQIAVLKPTDIDLSILHKQQEFVRLDPATERKAQQAIDEFFASSIDMPSPWSGERNQGHFLALISPSPAQMKKKANLMTPGVGKFGSSSTSATSSLSSSSQIRFQKVNAKNGRAVPTTPSEQLKMAQQSRIKDDEVFVQHSPVTKNTKRCTTSTQTTLTLPVNFDLEKLLIKFHTYEECHEKPGENVCEALSNSSLRRKLFFPEVDDAKAATKDGLMEPSPLKCIDYDHDDDKFIASPLSEHKTPHGKKSGEMPQTPSTCHSHFSSSPLVSGISYDLRTPCSGNVQRPRFGSDVRRRMMGSSEDEELMKIQMQDLESPQLSPVRADASIINESHSLMQDIGAHGVDGVSSMSFSVSCPQKSENTDGDDASMRQQLVSEKDTNSSSIESSRKQLLLDSPPLSPIEPIKHTLHLKNSSAVNYLNSSDNRSMGIMQPPFSLCPSPMLSPIPCGKQGKKKASRKTIPDSPLSSSTTSSHMQRKTEAIKIIKSSHSSIKGMNDRGQTDASSSKKSSNYYAKESLSLETSLEKKDFHDSESLENKENILPQMVVPLLTIQGGNSQELMNCVGDGASDITGHTGSHGGPFSSQVISRPIQFGNFAGCEPQGPEYKNCADMSMINSAEHTSLEFVQADETLNSTNAGDFAMDVSPRKPLSDKFQRERARDSEAQLCNVESNLSSDVANTCSMDVSVHHAPHAKYHDCDMTTSSNPTECQGDSGYSTAQSNLQAG